MTSKDHSPRDDRQPLLPMAAPLDVAAFWSWFGNCARAAEPVARCATRSGLELQSLAGSRLRAWAAIPETLARCRTPVDLVQCQMAFWQAAGRDYAEASQQVMAAWRGVLQGAEAASGLAGAVARDYISFPDTRPEGEGDRQQAAARRAA